MADGIAPDCRICFFDGNDSDSDVSLEDRDEISVTSDISQTFYFGLQLVRRFIVQVGVVIPMEYIQYYHRKLISFSTVAPIMNLRCSWLEMMGRKVVYL